MMYGFGDDSNPLPETVALVEDIVVEYVTDMVHKAQDIASKRGKLLTEDFLFLIRKDTPKLNRCTELLSMNEELKQARKAFDVDEEKLASAEVYGSFVIVNTTNIGRIKWRQLSSYEGEKELKEKEAESVNLESKDLTPVFVPAEVDSNESEGLEVDSEESETKDVSCNLDENEDNGLFTTENGLVIKDSVEKDSTKTIIITIILEKNGTMIREDENILATEKTDHYGVQVDMSPDGSLDSAPDSPVSAEAQETKSSNSVDQNLETVDSEPYPVNHEATLEPSMAALSQLSSHDNLPGFNMLIRKSLLQTLKLNQNYLFLVTLSVMKTIKG
nr:transcription initiation factor TFIID subunit 13 [Tanacetum cinerariifolium]